MAEKRSAKAIEAEAVDGDAEWERFRRWNVDFEARRHLALYERTHNGMHVWKAYLLYREHGLPVQDSIMQKIDAFAIGICRVPDSGDKTPPEKRIAEALQMHTPRGGISATVRASKVESRLQKVLAVRAFNTAYPQDGITKAYEAAAKEYGVSVQSIKKLYRDWVRFEVQGAKPRQTGDHRARKVRLMR